ncbi:type III secretion system (T3SS) translocator HrpF [Phyllobacterium myrsinacearum]|uniref:type III effector HrpK domain-containing protein n=1 Tax=Phyllobacterium myrsinacearum TaxID=28101 RepID=UPI0010294BAA|nr:type III effector HrpK domain-containing protein [Phyllobacterium myrsinacearum]RZS79877.1 type III secretion system (T3SS) translocator HrpF [Phyllobacterium myrsinacearum]
MAKVGAATSTNGAYNPTSTNPDAVKTWDEAKKQAQDAGILWERPKDDKRSADDILKDTPILRDLGNQEHVRDLLQDRVGGDIKTDADAAFRAAQILEHIEKLDGDGKRIAGGDIGNGRVDGFTRGGEARHNTEAGRLKDFGEQGFSVLKGKLPHASTANGNPEARKQAEDLDIKWELPESDKRSAKDIINDNPVLKNLGNQSNIKDMLKEQVGDFENDANAAYRASQVIDRVVMYNEKGEVLSGTDVSNTSIDGFTKGGEAKHGTEAGRLQDFGKYGFSSLPKINKTEDSSYKDFIDKNKSADETSKIFAKYASLINQNYDLIKGKTGAGDGLTIKDLQNFKDQNPQIGNDLKEALNFWSQPGAFSKLETGANPLTSKPDGKLSKDDITGWIKNEAPKDSSSAMSFLSSIVNKNVVSGVDTSKLNKDIFEHPEKHSTEDKAAALQELLLAQQLVVKGGQSGMWGDDYSKVAISNIARTNPDPKEILKDIDKQIDILQGDPEVVKYLNENSAKQMDKLLEGNKGLKDALQKTYEDDIKSGKALDKIWDSASKDGKTDQRSALAEFVTNAKLYQSALKMDPKAAAKDIQDAVSKSKHIGEFKSYYENQLVSGDRLKAMLKDHSFQDAVSTFSMETALYGSVLPPEFTEKLDKKLNENFTNLANEHIADGGSFKDIQKVFGLEGSGDLDVEKVQKLIEEVSKTNPDFFLNKDGVLIKPEQIVASLRGDWDSLRQGTKTLKEVMDIKGSTGANATDKGILHGVSGLLMAGITIARGAGSGGPLSDKQKVDITIGSVQAVTLLAEGGAKGYQDYLKGLNSNVKESLGKLNDKLRFLVSDPAKMQVELNDRMGKNAKSLEQSAKGVGAIANVIGSAYSLFEGVKALRSGDKVSAGMNLTSGALGIMAGGASAIEAGAGLFFPNLAKTALSALGFTGGVLGILSAGAGILAMLPSLIQEGKAQQKANDFGNLLGSYLTKYEIDGVPNGNIGDLPDSAWPKDTSVAS